MQINWFLVFVYKRYHKKICVRTIIFFINHYSIMLGQIAFLLMWYEAVGMFLN